MILYEIFFQKMQKSLFETGVFEPPAKLKESVLMCIFSGSPLITEKHYFVISNGLSHCFHQIDRTKSQRNKSNFPGVLSTFRKNSETWSIFSDHITLGLVDCQCHGQHNPIRNSNSAPRVKNERPTSYYVILPGEVKSTSRCAIINY